jgi:hypothetical protein
VRQDPPHPSKIVSCAAPRCAALRPWTHWPHHTTPQFSLNKKFPLFQKDWRVKPVTSTHTYYSQNVLLRITCTQSTRTARTLPAESRPISRRFSFREHGQLNENIAGASTGEMQTSLCFFSFFVLERRRRMQIAKASAGSMTNEKGTNFRWQKPRKCLQHAKQAASAAASTFPHGRARS